MLLKLLITIILLMIKIMVFNLKKRKKKLQIKDTLVKYKILKNTK